ncbi:MAG: HD domain-containing phosphohydrolase, partial [Pseudomonadota bacterium]
PEESQVVVRFINRLDHVGLLIRSHHERYDGQGFPDRLREEAIPLGARIIAVADAYDRIVNLKVKSKEAIAEYLKDADALKEHFQEQDLIERAAILQLKLRAFTHFDPDVVKSFLNALRNKGIRYDNEKPALIDSLKPGMVLSRAIYTSSGKFLLPHNTKLTEGYIQKLNILFQNGSITDTVYVMEN